MGCAILRLVSVTAMCGFLFAGCKTGPVSGSAHEYPGIPLEVVQEAQSDMAQAIQMATSLNGTLAKKNLPKNAKAVLGEGFAVHSVDVESLMNDSGSSILGLARPATDWEFILSVASVPTILTISKANGTYGLGSAGESGTALAEAIKTVRNHSGGKSVGDGPKLIRMGIGYLRYLAVKIDNEEFVVPATEPGNTEYTGGMDYTRLYPAKEAIAKLSQIAKSSAND